MASKALSWGLNIPDLVKVYDHIETDNGKDWEELNW